MKRNPLVIYPKDIQRITGKSESYARKIIRLIKKKVGKAKHQFVTFAEFCEFSGLSLDEVLQYLDR